MPDPAVREVSEGAAHPASADDAAKPAEGSNAPAASAAPASVSAAPAKDTGAVSGTGPAGASVAAAAEKKRKGTLDAGARFGRYEIVRVLGAGGMGAVYEAIHTDLKKRVALKTLHRTFAENADVQTRFMREGESASRIRHPHVVDVTDFGVHDGVPFLVMEFLEGESLAARVKRGPLLTASEAADILIPVCAAVSAAHEAQVIHRDLKPENVFLARVGRNEVLPKVVDFGVSKVIDPGAVRDLTTTNAMVGSPAYMPPEQILSSKNVEARSDEYSIGVTLYECVTGRKPFHAETLFELMAKIVQNDYDPPRVYRPELPTAFQDVIRKAMKASAEERYPSVNDLGRALLPFASPRIRSLWSSQLGLDPMTVEADSVRLSVVPAISEPSAQKQATAKYAAVNAATAAKATAAPESRTSTPPKSMPPEAIAAPVAPPRSRRTLVVSLGAFVFVGALGAAWFASRAGASPPAPSPTVHAQAVEPQHAPPPAPEPETYHATVHATPSAANFELDGQPAGTGTFDRDFQRDGHDHVLRVSADGFSTQTLRFRDTSPPDSIALTALAAPAPVAAPTVPPAAPEPAAHHGTAHAHGTQPHGHANTETQTQTQTNQPAVGGNGALIIP